MDFSLFAAQNRQEQNRNQSCEQGELKTRKVGEVWVCPVQGGVYNNGVLAADPKTAVQNFLNAPKAVGEVPDREWENLKRHPRIAWSFKGYMEKERVKKENQMKEADSFSFFLDE